MRKFKAILLFLAAFVFALPAMPARADQPLDLWPAFSKRMHAFNMGVIRVVKPNIEEYRRDKIPVVHKSLLNFTRNLREPLNFVNSTFTVDIEAMGTSLSRFVINSTLGVFGIFDVASEFGITRERRDLGTTLGFWGMPELGFFELPIAGPKTTRDTVGMVGDAFLDPWNWVIGFWPALAVSITGGLIEFDEAYDLVYKLMESSVDTYASFKSAHVQLRRRKIEEVNSIFFAGRAAKKSYDFDMDMDEEEYIEGMEEVYE